MCLYRTWLRLFHDACRHNISTYESISKLKTCIWFIHALINWFFKLWGSVEVICHALLILCCNVKRWLYVHNYWWAHNKINYQLFFHDWALYCTSVLKFYCLQEEILPVSRRWLYLCSRFDIHNQLILLYTRKVNAFEYEII